jgi:hypothetical protein
MVQAQLQLPPISSCNSLNHNPVDSSFYKSVEKIYDGSPYDPKILKFEDYNQMFDLIMVEHSDFSSYKTYLKYTHNNKHFYITLLKDDSGTLYDIIINKGYVADSLNYIIFSPSYYECEIIKGIKKDIEVKTYMSSSNINYNIKRKVVEVLDEDRFLTFKMDDGSDIKIEFCHMSSGNNYSDWFLYDTSGNQYSIGSSDYNDPIDMCHHHNSNIVEICNH